MNRKEELIAKLYEGTCTREELSFLLDLLKDDTSEDHVDVMKKLWEELQSYPDAKKSIGVEIRKQMFERITEQESSKEKSSRKQPAARLTYLTRRNLTIASAAAVMLLIGAFCWLWYSSEKLVLQQTAYGEIKELVLPDSSVVILNGNSSLSYQTNWKKESTRVVHLEGEAYFQVQKKPTRQTKFQVITDDLTVEVLGTIFNVNSHENQTRVFLEEGKVRVNLNHDATKTVNLNPGEAMRYSIDDQSLSLPKKANLEHRPNWTKGHMVFAETPLETILKEFAQAYKLEFVIKDAALAETQFTINLPTESVEEAMEILSKSIGASIHQEGTKYIIDVKTN